MTSLSSEYGFALFHEGGDTFAIIIGEAEFAHRVALALKLLRQSLAPALADHPFDRGEASCRAGGEAGGEGIDLRIERVVFDRFPDQAPLGGLLRWQLFGEPIGFAWIVLPSVLLIALFIALAGTWFPARRIARLYPVEVLYGRQ